MKLGHITKTLLFLILTSSISASQKAFAFKGNFNGRLGGVGIFGTKFAGYSSSQQANSGNDSSGGSGSGTETVNLIGNDAVISSQQGIVAVPSDDCSGDPNNCIYYIMDQKGIYGTFSQTTDGKGVITYYDSYDVRQSGKVVAEIEASVLNGFTRHDGALWLTYSENDLIQSQASYYTNNDDIIEYNINNPSQKITSSDAMREGNGMYYIKSSDGQSNYINKGNIGASDGFAAVNGENEFFTLTDADGNVSGRVSSYRTMSDGSQIYYSMIGSRFTPIFQFTPDAADPDNLVGKGDLVKIDENGNLSKSDIYTFPSAKYDTLDAYLQEQVATRVPGDFESVLITVKDYLYENSNNGQITDRRLYTEHNANLLNEAIGNVNKTIEAGGMCSGKFGDMPGCGLGSLTYQPGMGNNLELVLALDPKPETYPYQLVQLIYTDDYGNAHVVKRLKTTRDQTEADLQMAKDDLMNISAPRHLSDYVSNVSAYAMDTNSTYYSEIGINIADDTNQAFLDRDKVSADYCNYSHEIIQKECVETAQEFSDRYNAKLINDSSGIGSPTPAQTKWADDRQELFIKDSWARTFLSQLSETNENTILQAINNIENGSGTAYDKAGASLIKYMLGIDENSIVSINQILNDMTDGKTNFMSAIQNLQDQEGVMLIDSSSNTIIDKAFNDFMQGKIEELFKVKGGMMNIDTNADISDQLYRVMNSSQDADYGDMVRYLNAAVSIGNGNVLQGLDTTRDLNGDGLLQASADYIAAGSCFGAKGVSDACFNLSNVQGLGGYTVPSINAASMNLAIALIQKDEQGGLEPLSIANNMFLAEAALNESLVNAPLTSHHDSYYSDAMYSLGNTVLTFDPSYSLDASLDASSGYTHGGPYLINDKTLLCELDGTCVSAGPHDTIYTPSGYNPIFDWHDGANFMGSYIKSSFYSDIKQGNHSSFALQVNGSDPWADPYKYKAARDSAFSTSWNGYYAESGDNTIYAEATSHYYKMFESGLLDVSNHEQVNLGASGGINKDTSLFRMNPIIFSAAKQGVNYTSTAYEMYSNKVGTIPKAINRNDADGALAQYNHDYSALDNSIESAFADPGPGDDWMNLLKLSNDYFVSNNLNNQLDFPMHGVAYEGEGNTVVGSLQTVEFYDESYLPEGYGIGRLAFSDPSEVEAGIENGFFQQSMGGILLGLGYDMYVNKNHDFYNAVRIDAEIMIKSSVNVSSNVNMNDSILNNINLNLSYRIGKMIRVRDIKMNLYVIAGLNVNLANSYMAVTVNNAAESVALFGLDAGLGMMWSPLYVPISFFVDFTVVTYLGSDILSRTLSMEPINYIDDNYAGAAVTNFVMHPRLSAGIQIGW